MTFVPGIPETAAMCARTRPDPITEGEVRLPTQELRALNLYFR